MNPARTIGAAIATGRYTQIWVYLVATPLGAIAGTGAYVAIKLQFTPGKVKQYCKGNQNF